MNDSSGEGSNIVGVLIIAVIFIAAVIIGFNLLLDEGSNLLNQLLNLS